MTHVPTTSAPVVESAIQPGDIISGIDVAFGIEKSGQVLYVIGPIRMECSGEHRTSDCGGYHYRIQTTEISPITGRAMTAVVYTTSRSSASGSV